MLKLRLYRIGLILGALGTSDLVLQCGQYFLVSTFVSCTPCKHLGKHYLLYV